MIFAYCGELTMLPVESSRRLELSPLRLISLDHALLAIGVLGLSARLYVVHESIGCNDMNTWHDFARAVHRLGLGYLYDNEPGFNHPPLMGLMAGFFEKISLATGARFEYLFKAPSVLADMVSAVLIHHSWQLRRPRYAPLAFALFCWSPPSILVSGFHGNTDSICASFSLLAALLIDRGRPMLGGLALGAAVNVKLIPLMLVPLLISSAGGPKRVARFMAGLSVGAIPFIPVVKWHWKGYYEHAIKYRSNHDQWGITGMLAQLASAPNIAHFGQKWNAFWIDEGAHAIMLASFTLAAVNLWTRRWNARKLTACGFGSFLFLTPGFGVQYLVYPLPALFAINLKYAFIYSMVAGLYAFVLYYTSWSGTHLFYSGVPPFLPGGVLSLGYCTWICSLLAVIDVL
jgi:hypothetical protein